MTPHEGSKFFEPFSVYSILKTRVQAVRNEGGEPFHLPIAILTKLLFTVIIK